MNKEKVFDENGQGFTEIFLTEKVDRVNPIEYYKTVELEERAILLRESLNAKNPFLTSHLDDNFFIKKAEQTLVDFCEHYERIDVHKNFIELLKTTRKKDQERLLKGLTLNLDELMCIIFKSYNDFGFLYSKNLFENLSDNFTVFQIESELTTLEFRAVTTL